MVGGVKQKVGNHLTPPWIPQLPLTRCIHMIGGVVSTPINIKLVWNTLFYIAPVLRGTCKVLPVLRKAIEIFLEPV
jgi:hypothetical protein